MVTPLSGSVPDVVSLLELINTSPGNWYAAIGPANAFFSIAVNKNHWKQFAFRWQGQRHNFPVPSQRYSNFPAGRHHLIHRNLDLLCLPQTITLIHYTDDIMLIRPSEQEVVTTLDLLVRPWCVRGWEINLAQIQGSSISVKFLGVQWRGGMSTYPF